MCMCVWVCLNVHSLPFFSLNEKVEAATQQNFWLQNFCLADECSLLEKNQENKESQVWLAIENIKMQKTRKEKPHKKRPKEKNKFSRKKSSLSLNKLSKKKIIHQNGKDKK